MSGPTCLSDRKPAKKTHVFTDSCSEPEKQIAKAIFRMTRSKELFQIQGRVAVNGFFGIVGNLAAVFPLGEYEIHAVHGRLDEYA